jgi:4-methyl-5(b-hydroxyethyl)-thiazole monophosphate biosynthesis
MKVMVPFANGFEEVEALTAVDVLRRAGINVDMVGLVGSVIEGAHGVRVMMDKKLPDAKAEDYDGIILPGGSPGYVNLGRSSVLTNMVKEMNSRGKLVAAICGASSILASAGVLDNKRATIYPGMERELPYPREDRVVVDGNVVTSQGPGTAMEFALKIVEILAGASRAASVRKSLVA